MIYCVHCRVACRATWSDCFDCSPCSRLKNVGTSHGGRSKQFSMPRIICTVSLSKLQDMLDRLFLMGYRDFLVSIDDQGRILIRGTYPV